MEHAARELGADRALGTLQLTIFVPSVDRDRVPIDQIHWREAALDTLARLFQGATAFPPGRGAWRDDARGGALVFDDTVMVVSYVDPTVFGRVETQRTLREFLHRMGREARQGEIGVVVGGYYLAHHEL
jgi:hypothetical protein